MKTPEGLRRGLTWSKERGWERRKPLGPGEAKANTRRFAPATTAAALALAQQQAAAAGTTSSLSGASARAGAAGRSGAGAVKIGRAHV